MLPGASAGRTHNFWNLLARNMGERCFSDQLGCWEQKGQFGVGYRLGGWDFMLYIRKGIVEGE